MGRDLTGRALGVYALRARLGTGGMGDVYRAHDTRLGRDVALKILPEVFAADPDRVRRFEKEARAASALSHPNIVTVYEIGTADAVSYIAMELVEGKTLRDAVAAGPMPIKRLLELAAQIADGLARAHEAGIVHRDLKPENVMVSKDGFAKILDFGLAKRLPFENSDASGVPGSTLTESGFIVGTVGYMSPEQASGRPVDFHSDQFALGAILYELVSGRRAFESPSKGEALAAIIRDQPDRAPLSAPGVPAPLRWIIERCLAKEPEERFACTRDLARELQMVRARATELSGEPEEKSRPVWPWLAAGLAALAITLGVLLARRPDAFPPVPDFQRLTFQRGTIGRARFTPDGRTIVYAAARGSAPLQLYSARTDGRDSTRLDLPAADVLSVSSTGEIAMLLGVLPGAPLVQPRTLARVPLTGGAPRELFDGVTAADWSPDGSQLAIARSAGGKTRLEYPAGKLLFESDASIKGLRVSPAGDSIAVLSGGDAIVDVEVVDMAGRRTVLSRGWKRAGTLAWSPDGKEVWLAPNERALRTPLLAIDMRGKSRVLLRLPSWINLQDVSKNGDALVSLMEMRSRVRASIDGESPERDLSWHDLSFAKELTPDGKTLVFDEGNEGYFHAIYVRPTDGSPAKRVGEGRSLAISPDGKWVASNARERGSALVLLPTGAGESRVLDDGARKIEEARFFSDSRRLLAIGKRSWIVDTASGRFESIGPDGALCSAVSPSGDEVACSVARSAIGVRCRVGETECRTISGMRPGEIVFQWSADGRRIYVGLSLKVPLRIDELELATGHRQFWREFVPDELSATPALYYFTMTPDGKSYAYSSWSASSDLYLVTGLK